MAKSPYIEWHDDFVELKPGFFNSAMDRSVPMTKKRAKAFAELENTLPARLTHEEAELLRWLIFAVKESYPPRRLRARLVHSPCVSR